VISAYTQKSNYANALSIFAVMIKHAATTIFSITIVATVAVLLVIVGVVSQIGWLKLEVRGFLNGSPNRS
jgi:hypothetical protein